MATAGVDGGAVIYRFPAARARAVRRQVARRRTLTGLVLVVAVSGWLLAAGPQGEAIASRHDSPRAVTLTPGETLWDVAERYAPPSVDPRAYVDTLLEHNDLTVPPGAGTRLKLPR